jgi:hypothetical protein
MEIGFFMGMPLLNEQNVQLRLRLVKSSDPVLSASPGDRVPVSVCEEKEDMAAGLSSDTVSFIEPL